MALEIWGSPWYGDGGTLPTISLLTQQVSLWVASIFGGLEAANDATAQLK